MEEKIKDIYIEAQSSFLKDSYGNFILPRTSTGLVTNSEGNSVDELLALVPNNEDINKIEQEILFLKRSVSNLNLKVKYTNAIQDLYHDVYNRKISLGDQTITNIYNERDNLINREFGLINDKLNGLDTRLKEVENKNKDNNLVLDKLFNSKVNKSDFNNMIRETENMNDEIEELHSQIIDLHAMAATSNDLFNSLLLAVIDLISINPDIKYPDLDTEQGERIIKIYKYLFDKEKIEKDEIPEEIWEKIEQQIENANNAKLVEEFLKM